jgi:hypothetical protein
MSCPCGTCLLPEPDSADYLRLELEGRYLVDILDAATPAQRDAATIVGGVWPPMLLRFVDEAQAQIERARIERARRKATSGVQRGMFR